MKKHLLGALVASLVLLTGCWDKKKVQPVQAKNEEVATQPTASQSSNNAKNSLLSFFNDQDINEDSDLVAITDADESLEGSAFELADAGDKVHEKSCVVYFDYDSTHPRKDQGQAVAELNQKINEWIDEGYQVAFCGHSCRYHGTDIYNMALSEQRAQSLKKMCALDNSKVKVFGVGNEQPVVAEDMTKEGQAPNRRVEVYPIAVNA